MNIETLLSIRAYGTSEGVSKAWDARGRGQVAKNVLGIDSLKPKNRDDDDFHQVHVERLQRAMEQAYKSGGGKGDTSKMTQGVLQQTAGLHDIKTLQPQNRDSADFHDLHVSTISRMLDKAHDYGKSNMTAACRGANCGRKGKKAGAKPLRSYMTKQETDTLKSTMRRKARKRY